MPEVQKNWHDKEKAKVDYSFYNTAAWRRTSKLYRIQNPLCEECKINEITKAAEVVDHIKAIIDGGSKLEWNNLQSLCKDCHATKTAKDNADRRKQNKIQ